MPLSSEKLDSIKNLVSEKENPIQNIEQNVVSAIKDPFGSAVVKVFNKVNNMTSTLEKKIDQLAQDVVKSTDGKGRVALEGNTIVVTITKENADQASELKQRIESKVANIQSTIVTLQGTLQTVQALQTAITTLQTTLSIQESILSLNPTTGPIFQVFKKAIKIVFLKDMIKEYSLVIKRQVQLNLQTLNSITSKFRDLQVSIKIQDESNLGSYIDQSEAESLLAQDLLGYSSNLEEPVENVTEEYISNSGVQYILKVEKYGEKKIIAKAFEKVTGLLEEQTAPSFFSTPEDLLEELKTILNLR
jgi:hypothetical protein